MIHVFRCRDEAASSKSQNLRPLAARAMAGRGAPFPGLRCKIYGLVVGVQG
jgi:hypothetical protein